LQDTLTGPKFSEMFHSGSMHYWLMDTMKTRYATLERLLRRLKDLASQILAERKYKEETKIKTEEDIKIKVEEDS